MTQTRESTCGASTGMLLLATACGFAGGMAVSYRLAWRWLYRPRER